MEDFNLGQWFTTKNSFNLKKKLEDWSKLIKQKTCFFDCSPFREKSFYIILKRTPPP